MSKLAERICDYRNIAVLGCCYPPVQSHLDILKQEIWMQDTPPLEPIVVEIEVDLIGGTNDFAL